MLYLLGFWGFFALLYTGFCLYFSRKDPNITFSHDTAVEPDPPLPVDFLWGTATSAHQIEGGNTNNDWSRFEEEGNVAHGESSGLASDHWNRVPEDISLMKSLGANAYRLSLEWSRLEPEQGVFDEEAWERYVDEISQLREAGITPMVTLLHFTLPRWLAKRGGLCASDFPERFKHFAEEAAKRLWSLVTLWCTINEPNVQILQGYLEKNWPPEKRAPEEALYAFSNLLRAHAAASAVLHENDPEAQVGVAANLVVFDPKSRANLLDWFMVRAANKSFNWSFYDSIMSGRIRFSLPGLPTVDEPLHELIDSVDFFGLNYYTRYLLRFSPGVQGIVAREPGPGPKSDMGWEIYPEGLLRLIRAAWKRYRLPIYITENGIADASGEKRGAFIRAHTHALSQAIAEGIWVRSYFHWSLLDNFEWKEGFSPRFGLYQVDYATQERSPAPGSEDFKALAPETLDAN